MKPIVQNIAIGCLISLCSGSVGFGISQASIVKQVTENTGEIHHLQKADDAIRAELLQERIRTDTRIFESVNLMKEILKASAEQAKQTTELIQLLKLQNQIRNP